MKLPPPTNAFLDEVRERARRYGWSGDYTELRDWLAELYREAEIPIPDLEPYPICKVCDNVTPECICEVNA